MGQYQTLPTNELTKEYEEIKVFTQEAVKEAKIEQKKELFIAEKLGFTQFEIMVERGPWDLEAILSYTKRLKEMK